MQLVFASQNQNKLAEICEIIGRDVDLISITDLGHNEPLEETGNSFKENAFQKASFISEKYKVNCFAEDSGLVVEALNGEPGIYSARYAGKNASDHENLDLLVKKMQDIQNRNAAFVTEVALILEDKTHYFEGRIKGKISYSPKGNSGFGYDPVFIPEGFSKTFAEMTQEEKNKLSHRGQAIRKMAYFLRK